MQMPSGVNDSAQRSERRGWLNAASYWMPRHLPVSAWVEHAPFAFWAVAALRPRTVVELGTHWGYSFFVFCEAIRRLELGASAFALDTWQGEDHSGLYGEEVYQYVAGVSARDYKGIATLLRGYFDDSVDAFDDRSIDLLHIDGRHGYEDVRHDFHTYLPKLSSRAVVLFHDIAERRPDFGVWRFWEEIRSDYPSFTFTHNHGLGVLGVGDELPAEISAILGQDLTTEDRIRAEYECLGAQITRQIRLEGLPAELERLETTSSSTIRSLEAENLGLKQQLEGIRSSTSWRVTEPLRAVASLLKRT